MADNNSENLNKDERSNAQQIEEEINKADSAQESRSQYSLNDDRRVKTLSPGMLVFRRFIRNKLAVVGLIMLAAMFIFSFIGGLISPYGEDQQFYTYEMMEKEYVAVTENNDYRYYVADGQEFGSILQAQVILALNTNKTEFTYKDVTYELTKEGDELYTISQNGTVIAMAYKDIVNATDGNNDALSFNFKRAALLAYAKGESSFEADGTQYELSEEGGITSGGEDVGFISRFVVQSSTAGVTIPERFREELQQALESGESTFEYTDDEGNTATYKLQYNPSKNLTSVLQETATYVYDSYKSPSKEHWLGTDKNGMDVLTRLMYGGRVSLMIGFLVVIIESVLGILMGGLAGYFGGWVDNLIMRIVDIFYCIPSMPLIIILGSAMDGMHVDPQVRMIYLMMLLGLLGWPYLARVIRGQILSLREQEFMTATEATGLRVSRRIFRHLVPNVIPQLIVLETLRLGSTILTEATLSFLGLGVKFPFASWGNIINDANNSFVMTHYGFIWIPAGICLLITVMGFNFVGDGLRDAFDPRMKR